MIVLRRTYDREIALRDRALADIRNLVDSYITSRVGQEPRITLTERYLQTAVHDACRRVGHLSADRENHLLPRGYAKRAKP